MTKDFRHIGLGSANSPTAAPQAASTSPAAPRRLILRIVLLAALAFLAAGLWLLSGGASPFPRQISLYLGIALTVAGLSDLAVIAVLKRVWARQP